MRLEQRPNCPLHLKVVGPVPQPVRMSNDISNTAITAAAQRHAAEKCHIRGVPPPQIAQFLCQLRLTQAEHVCPNAFNCRHGDCCTQQQPRQANTDQHT